jgi:flagellar protein FlbD
VSGSARPDRAAPIPQVGGIAADVTFRRADGPALLTFQGWIAVIIVTRLNGPAFAVNPDLIERAESTPDTVVTLVDGTKYVIAESLPRLIELIRDYRASVIAAAHSHETRPVEPEVASAGAPAALHTVVELHPRDR